MGLVSSIVDAVSGAVRFVAKAVGWVARQVYAGLTWLLEKVGVPEKYAKTIVGIGVGVAVGCGTWWLYSKVLGIAKTVALGIEVTARITAGTLQAPWLIAKGLGQAVTKWTTVARGVFAGLPWIVSPVYGVPGL